MARILGKQAQAQPVSPLAARQDSRATVTNTTAAPPLPGRDYVDALASRKAGG